jgi:hypothetical protein
MANEHLRHVAIAKLLESAARPTRVFISFDYDRMLFEAKALGEQLRNSNRFDIQNWSMKEAAPERLWRNDARARLQRSDVMLIVCDAQTYRAPGVVTEVGIARSLEPQVPIRQVCPSRVGVPQRLPAPGVPTSVWTHDNLEKLLAVPRRTVTL